MSALFELNQGHPDLPAEANISVTIERDELGVMLSFSLQNVEFNTFGEYLITDAAEIQEFFDMVDRAKAHHDLLIRAVSDRQGR